jgi:DNA-directed RNA polymerase subunit RPC12/RpoP
MQPEPPKPETAPKYVCQECQAEHDKDELIRLYECGECGTVFPYDEITGNRCEDCNKFAAKLTDCGCPECEQGECEKDEPETETEKAA